MAIHNFRYFGEHSNELLIVHLLKILWIFLKHFYKNIPVHPIEFGHTEILAEYHEFVDVHDCGLVLDLLESGVIAGRVTHTAVMLEYGEQVLPIIFGDLPILAIVLVVADMLLDVFSELVIILLLLLLLLLFQLFGFGFRLVLAIFGCRVHELLLFLLLFLYGFMFMLWLFRSLLCLFWLFLLILLRRLQLLRFLHLFRILNLAVVHFWCMGWWFVVIMTYFAVVIYYFRLITYYFWIVLLYLFLLFLFDLASLLCRLLCWLFCYLPVMADFAVHKIVQLHGLLVCPLHIGHALMVQFMHLFHILVQHFLSACCRLGQVLHLTGLSDHSIEPLQYSLLRYVLVWLRSGSSILRDCFPARMKQIVAGPGWWWRHVAYPIVFIIYICIILNYTRLFHIIVLLAYLFNELTCSCFNLMVAIRVHHRVGGWCTE